MTNENYLGHNFYCCDEVYNFICHDKYLTFKCSICSIIGYYYQSKDIFTTDDENKAEPIKCNDNDTIITYKKLIMTCAEIQIKRLLE